MTKKTRLGSHNDAENNAFLTGSSQVVVAALSLIITESPSWKRTNETPDTAAVSFTETTGPAAFFGGMLFPPLLLLSPACHMTERALPDMAPKSPAGCKHAMLFFQK